MLESAPWPGNLIQLQSVLSSLLLSNNDDITVDHLQAILAICVIPQRPIGQPCRRSFRVTAAEAREAFERIYFENLLGRESSNMSRVADPAGLPERTHLYRKLKQLNIRFPRVSGRIARLSSNINQGDGFDKCQAIIMSSRSWLFLVPVLIWSTTFYAITPAARQRNHADLCRCVALRLRGDIAVRLARTSASPRTTGIRHSSLVLASGLTSYGISYVFTYVAEESIPSGLVAIAYTLMVFFDTRHRIFRLSHGCYASHLAGGSLGVAGVAPASCRICWVQRNRPAHFLGHGCNGGSCVDVERWRCLLHQVEPDAGAGGDHTAWAMMYGAIATALYGAFSGQSLQLDGRLSFKRFLYLSVAGTIIAFLCYLTVTQAWGWPARCISGAVAGWCGDCFSPVGGAASANSLRAGILISMAGAWITLVNKKA